MKTLLITMDFPPLIGGIANYYWQRVKQMPKDEIVVLFNASSIVIPAQAGIQAEKNWILNPSQMRGKQFQDDNRGTKIYRRKFLRSFIWPHWLPLIWQIYKIIKKEKITHLWAGQVLPVGTAVWVVWKMCNLFSSCHPHESEDLVVQSDSRLRENDIKKQGDKKFSFFVTCHGNDLLRAKNQPRKFKLAKKILKDAKFVEANTEFTKNILINDFQVPDEKIKVIYPINTLKKEMVNEQKVGELREKYNLSNKKVLLTVARLVESKGVDKVIEALPKVWQEIPDLIYLVVGAGPEKNKLTQIAEDLVGTGRDLSLPTQNKIIFAGAVDYEKLPNYYALANVFIMTPRRRGSGTSPSTDTESFGVVYLEAIEFGLPIITSDVGGVKEALQNYQKTSLVDPDNINDLADKIIELFCNSDLQIGLKNKKP